MQSFFLFTVQNKTVTVTAHVFQCFLRMPVQFSVGLGAVGIVFRQISCSSRGNNIRNLYIIDLLIGVNDVQNTVAFTGSDVIDIVAALLVRDLFQSPDKKAKGYEMQDR